MGPPLQLQLLKGRGEHTVPSHSAAPGKPSRDAVTPRFSWLDEPITSSALTQQELQGSPAPCITQHLEMLLLGSWVWHQAQLLTPTLCHFGCWLPRERCSPAIRVRISERAKEISNICLHFKLLLRSVKKHCSALPKAWQDHSSFLGVGMEISNPAWGTQQHRALRAPETQPLIYCCKCRGQPSCQLWKARMLMVKLLSQILIFFWFFLLEIQLLAA